MKSPGKNVARLLCRSSHNSVSSPTMYLCVQQFSKTTQLAAMTTCKFYLRTLLSERINHCLSLLKNNKLVDKNMIAAIGYCFGGKCVLDLARSGAELNLIVSFHGIYDRPNINNPNEIKTPILILHGDEDPYATEQDLNRALQKSGYLRYFGACTSIENAGERFHQYWQLEKNATADKAIKKINRYSVKPKL